MNLDTKKLTDLTFVRTMAQIKANKDDEDQVIFKTKKEGYEIYRFTKKTKTFNAGIETVCPTRRDTSEAILSNIGDGGESQLEPIEEKKIGKGKSRTIIENIE